MTIGIAGVAVGILLTLAITNNQAVCHSITEDSIITDCDYRDGAWYRK